MEHVRTPIQAGAPVTEPLGQTTDATIAAVGQEVVKTNAAAWHAAGITGAGVKVGIIDFFQRSVWDAAKTAGEVPAPSGTFCRSSGATCDVFGTASKHGTAVAEIVHEMAPGAKIYIATVLTTADLQLAINYFASQGVTVVTRSLTAEYDGKGDGTGPIDQVVGSAVAQGITWFNSAGNSAGKVGSYVGSYWRGSWADANANGWLDWSGTDELMSLPCIGGSRFTNGLRWSDWASNRTDYDLYLFDDSGAVVQKESSTDDQQAGADPIERLSGACSDTDYLGVYRYAAGGGSGGDILEFQVNGSGLEHWQNAYSAAVPAADSASAGALAIGAIDPPAGTTIAVYSSQGPTNDGRTKPDISAAACVTSFTYSPSCFNGTSSASPVAAGAAALVKSAGLGSTPSQLKSYLLTQAFVDRGSAGADNVYGAGELVLPAPPSNLCPPDDAYEPNESLAAAKTVANGVGISGIACPNNQDLFKISASAGTTISVDLSLVHADGNIDMTLRNGASTILASSAGTGNTESIDYSVTTTATYYVQVYGNPIATTSNEYGLTVSLTSPTNTAPTISDIADQSTPQNTAEGPIAFAIGDGETAAGSLTVSASSSNQTLVPNGNLSVGGSGANRTITITPAAGQTGAATITVTVSDGLLTDTDTFVQTVTAAASGAPVAGFVASPLVSDAPTVVQLTDTSTNTPTSWLWEITDALRPSSSFKITKTTQNPSLALAFEGLYTVKLTVSNASGSDSLERTSYIEVDPPNDDFVNAAAILNLGTATDPVATQFTDTATLEKGELNPDQSCISNMAGAAISNTVWYRLHLPSSAMVTIATEAGSADDSDFDTILEVGPGTSAATFAPIACNDDIDFTGGNYRSRLTVGLKGGVDYMVRVGGFRDYGLLTLYVYGKVDTTAPSVTLAKPTLYKSPMKGTALPVRLRWTASDGTGTGIDRFQIQRRACPSTCGAWANFGGPLSGTTRVKIVYSPAGAFQYRVLAYDRATNYRVSSAQALRLTGYQNSVSMFSRGWVYAKADSNAWGLTYGYGSSGRARLSVSSGTRQVAWVARIYSTAGSARVYVDGVYRATISLRTASSAGWKRLAWVGSVTTTRTHSIEIRWSSGRINVDAMVTAR
ncbi:MAG: S8 family serine peptidase [Chloroflexi bacterium]|nr:S8 family serine peptidase [Chloroflexota bacterium]